MKHILERTVYYADTDAYGVAWHGSYIKWMEAARVELCREVGLDLVEMKANDVLTPVTNLSIRYKSSAKLDEVIVVETNVQKITPLTIVFSQVIKEKETGKVHTIAEIEVVAVNNEGKLYRRIPEKLKNALENFMIS